METATTGEGKPRILVVDDDPDVLDALMVTLSDDFEVVARGSAESALELLEQGDFLVVIADYFMPGMSGLQLLERVSKRATFTAGLLLTAHMEVLSKPEWLDGRSSSIIFKPFIRTDLINQVHQLVQVTKMRRTVRAGVPPGRGR